MLQKEGSGLLPACLSVRLLLSICLQTHASVIVQPTEWEVCGADPRSLPLLWIGAALHHPHQTQLLQEQLELRRYKHRAADHTNKNAVMVQLFSCSLLFSFHCLSPSMCAEGIGEGVEREDCVQALSGQIFMGMVSSQFQARLDTVRLIDALVTACIRFVYFSMEDELRSKVNTHELI